LSKSGVDGRWVGAAGEAASGSLVNSRWVGSGYSWWHGRWVGVSVELSVTVV